MSDTEHTWRNNGHPPTLVCFLCEAPVSRPQDVIVDAEGEPTGYGVCEAHRESGPAAVLMNLLDDARQALREIAAGHGIPVEATTAAAYNMLRDRAARAAGITH